MGKKGKGVRKEIITYLVFILIIGILIYFLFFITKSFTGFVIRGPNWEENNESFNSYTLKIYGTTINYYDGSEYVPIIFDFTNSSDPLFNYMTSQGYYEAYFKKNPTLGQVVKYIRNSTEVTFQPMALNYRNDLSQISQISMIQGVSGYPQNNLFRYSNAYGQGINLEYAYLPLILKEQLVINSSFNLVPPPAYIIDGGNPTLDVDFVFSTNSQHIVIEGADWDKSTQVSTQNEVYVKDDSGNVIYYFPKPYAYDSNGSRQLLTYLFKKSGVSLYVNLKTSYSWLSDSSRVYPIYIDPSIRINVSDNGADAYVSKAYPNKNYGDVDELKVQRVAWERSYLRFDITSIPINQVIDNASLCLYLFVDQAEQIIKANHVYDNGWCEGDGGTDGIPSCEITWNNQPCGSEEEYLNFSFCNLTIESNITTDSDMDNTWQCFSIINMLKQEYNSGNENLSIILWTNDTGSADKFYSKEYTNPVLWPYLNITYHTANTAPFLNLIEPQNTLYTFNESLSINYNVFDYDDNLDSCWYSLDSENNITLPNCENSSFNISEGIHLISVYANDSYGEISNDEVIFSVDMTGVNLSVSEPKGTKTSRTEIPILYSVVGNNLSCWYDIKTSIGGIIIGNTTLINCSNSVFNVSSDGDYFLVLHANNSLGSYTSKNSSFSVSSYSSPPASSSSGGSGGSFITVAEITLEKIRDLIVEAGKSKKMNLHVKNTGTRFLNDCKLKEQGIYSSWVSVSSQELKDLAAGEEYDFTFTLNVPEKTEPGKKQIDMGFSCKEISKNTSFFAEVIEKEIAFDLIRVERETPENVNIFYSLEEFSGKNQDVEIQFMIFGTNNEEVAEAKENLFISANSKQDFQTSISIPSELEGTLNLLININSDTYSSFAQESIVLGVPIGGFAVLENSARSDNIITGILILLFGIFAFFIVRKILRSRKIQPENFNQVEGFTSKEEERRDSQFFT